MSKRGIAHGRQILTSAMHRETLPWHFHFVVVKTGIQHDWPMIDLKAGGHLQLFALQFPVAVKTEYQDGSVKQHWTWCHSLESCYVERCQLPNKSGAINWRLPLTKEKNDYIHHAIKRNMCKCRWLLVLGPWENTPSLESSLNASGSRCHGAQFKLDSNLIATWRMVAGKK